jgi:hypothetical protein
MKKNYFIGILIIFIFAISFTNDTNPLIGKWEYTGLSNGAPFKLLAIFRLNGTFDGFINKKEFVSGTYHLNKDTLYMSDATCNANYEGKYRVEYFGQHDSLKFHVLQDTCAGRREGTNGKLFRKVVSATKQ